MPLHSKPEAGVSVFSGQPTASAGEIATAIARLKACFPRLEQKTKGEVSGYSFWTELGRSILRNGISGRRLEYICNIVIDTFEYSDCLTVAEIIKIDRRIEPLTGSEQERNWKDGVRMAVCKLRTMQGDRYYTFLYDDAVKYGMEIVREC